MPNQYTAPKLTFELVEQAIRAYHKDHEKCPSALSGDASGYFGFSPGSLSWNNLNLRLREGPLGVNGCNSLPKFCAGLGLKNLRSYVAVTLGQIEQAMRNYAAQHNGAPPISRAGDATLYFEGVANSQISWESVNRKLQKGSDGLPVTTLAELAKKMGLTHPQNYLFHFVEALDSGKAPELQAILEQIPPDEMLLVDMYYRKKMLQTEIAQVIGVSQPTVNYGLQRATERVQFLLAYPPPEDAPVREALEEIVTDPRDVEIMLGMKNTTCQSVVARQMGVSQGFVRHRFLKTLKLLQKREECGEYARFFDGVLQNLNVLRKVREDRSERHEV